MSEFRDRKGGKIGGRSAPLRPMETREGRVRDVESRERVRDWGGRLVVALGRGSDRLARGLLGRGARRSFTCVFTVHSGSGCCRLEETGGGEGGRETGELLFWRFRTSSADDPYWIQDVATRIADEIVVFAL
jgi:hypothetical protein